MNAMTSVLASLSVAFVFSTAACASSAPPPPAPSTPVTGSPTTSSGSVAPDLCDLVLDRPDVDEPDHHAQAVENAEKVIKGMEADLLACYKKRVAVSPQAHGFITVDTVIGPDGRVQRVETTGGALLGEGTMACIVDRMKQATFDKPRGGGTYRVHVPFALRRVAPGETP